MCVINLLLHFFILAFSFLQSAYDDAFLKTVYQSPVVTLDELKRGMVMTREPIRIAYHTKEQYKRATKNLGLMDDFKVSAGATCCLLFVPAS